MTLQDICGLFDVENEVTTVEPYGNGHINTTYLATDTSGKQYILQRINNRVFPDVKGLMRNIMLTTEHLKAKVIRAGGDPMRECLSLIYTKNKKPYVEVDGGFYRMYVFITGATAYDKARTPDDFYESAVLLGRFIRQIGDFDTNRLTDVIPDFHNTEKRFVSFLRALKNDVRGRADSVKPEIDWLLNKEKYASRVVSLLRSGAIPTRVTHNDTKLNNMMLDDVTGKGVAVIDFDTIMRGTLLYDFGDAIRFGCNTAAENESDLTKVNFDYELYQTFTKGFLSECMEFITPIEKKYLVFGSCLMIMECGMRFLTDYLCGDNYFKIHYPGENLDRARNQFKLLDEVEKARFDLIDWTMAL